MPPTSADSESAAQDRVIESCWELVTAWATDPGLTLNAVPRLCEALREFDEFGFDQAFAAGVEARPVSSAAYIAEGEALNALRRGLLAQMSEWSEENWAAGWMSGTEEMLQE